MEHTLDRIHETIDHLVLKLNAPRQENIVEEIEVIRTSNFECCMLGVCFRVEFLQGRMAETGR